MKNLLFLAFFFALSAHAYDHTLSTQAAFTVSSNEAARKLEDSLLFTEGLLKHFEPAGVEVLKRSVNGNAFEFLVVKRLIGIPKQIDIKGTLIFEKVENGCQGSEEGYLGTVDLTGSEVFVTDTIESFKFLFCSAEKSVKSLNVKATNTLYYKGKKFNFIVEKIARGIVEEQVNAIVDALKADIAGRKF